MSTASVRQAFRRNKGNFIFFGLEAIAALAGLCVFPGIDLLAYHFLQPFAPGNNYWMKFAFVAGAVVTAFPMAFIGFLLFIGLTAIVVNILD